MMIFQKAWLGKDKKRTTMITTKTLKEINLKVSSTIWLSFI